MPVNKIFTLFCTSLYLQIPNLYDSGRYGVPFLSDHNPVYALYKL